ncbi:MAG: preprotein translocase subunit SecE [Anaerolineae bacterium]|nr:preprotein translocase subunit SecE [Anaerolineae bacterium]
MAKSKSRSNSTTVSTRESNFLVKYFNETRAELRKVTWPTRDETQNLTMIIVIVTVAMAIFLGTLDYLFQVVAAGVIGLNPVSIAVAVVLFAIGAAAFYFNNQEV